MSTPSQSSEALPLSDMMREMAAAQGIVPRVLVLMGVSGSGKSTIALELHRVLGWPFQEGDDLVVS